MIDIHSHILPGLDDGAENWEQSLEMARVAAMDGISGIVCTPHYSPVFPGNNREEVMAYIELFRVKLHEARIQLELYPGCELAIDSRLPGKILSGEVLTINDTGKFALLEMPPGVIPPNLDRFFWMLQAEGINIVLAHPERNFLLSKNPSILFDWVQGGILVQITSGSLIGSFGQEIGEFSRTLLSHRMVHFIASDSHGYERRRPKLSKARAAAESIVGAEEAHRIFYEYPAGVLEGVVPDAPPPIPVEKKKSVVRRFFQLR